MRKVTREFFEDAISCAADAAYAAAKRNMQLKILNYGLGLLEKAEHA